MFCSFVSTLLHCSVPTTEFV